jgi:hypothetical protein
MLRGSATQGHSSPGNPQERDPALFEPKSGSQIDRRRSALSSTVRWTGIFYRRPVELNVLIPGVSEHDSHRMLTEGIDWRMPVRTWQLEMVG